MKLKNNFMIYSRIFHNPLNNTHTWFDYMSSIFDNKVIIIIIEAIIFILNLGRKLFLFIVLILFLCIRVDLTKHYGI